MKEVILVSGFLGSGKTTFIIALMKYLSKKNLKVALIVNELGEIGIDNQYMKQLGYNVWEIFGGCICCTLSTNLETTLEDLKQNYASDVILVEPSGAAEPKMIYDSFINLGIEEKKIHNFLILDSTRIDMFIEILSPLLNSSLSLADTVIINKVDLASKEELNKCFQTITSTKSDIFTFQLNFHEPLSLEFEEYVGKLF